MDSNSCWDLLDHFVWFCYCWCHILLGLWPDTLDLNARLLLTMLGGLLAIRPHFIVIFVILLLPMLLIVGFYCSTLYSHICFSHLFTSIGSITTRMAFEMCGMYGDLNFCGSWQGYPNIIQAIIALVFSNTYKMRLKKIWSATRPTLKENGGRQQDAKVQEVE